MEKSEKVKLFEHIVYNQPVTKLYNFISTDIEFYEDGIGYNHKILFSNSKRSLGFILCIAYENNKYGDTLSIVIGKEDNVDIDEEPWFFFG